MKKINSAIKNTLISFYRTKTGQKLWKFGVTQIRRPFIKLAIQKALDQANLSPSNHNFSFCDGNLNLDKNSKHALVIFPFLGLNAVGNNIIEQCRKLKEVGYVVHGLNFSNFPEVSQDTCFDTFKTLACRDENFGKWNLHKELNLFERNKIDDWVTDELLDYIALLDKYFSIDLCICHYNFLSLALTALSQNTYKIIYTHDIFVGRNKKLFEVGLTHKDFYFSCSKEEEKKGLKRADLVLAIQEDEANYIKNELGISNVLAMPFIPEVGSKTPKEDKNSRNSIDNLTKKTCFVVGYFAGSHKPNKIAFDRFLKAFGSHSDIKIAIGGGISCFYANNPDSNIEVLGAVEDLKTFYSKCDVCVNPDTLVSGMKIKTIEAMVFDIPVVCTRAASTGLDSSEPLHLLENEENVAEEVLKLLRKGPDELERLKGVSSRIVSSLRRKYSFYTLFNEIYTESLKKKIPLVARSEIKKTKVSVILPCYKVEKYLAQAIASVSSQTLRDIEIITVDDCSPDNGRLIIEQFAQLDERIIPIFLPTNKGYGAAINEALKVAKGEYISIVEPDDWIAPNMLEELYKATDKGKQDIVKAGFFKHFVNRKTAEKNYFCDLKKDKGYQVIDIPSYSSELVLGESSIWSAIYKKSFLEKNNLSMLETPGASYQDVVWKFCTYSSTCNIRLIPGSFYHYRVQTQNSSSKSNSKPLVVFDNYAYIQKLIKNKGQWNVWRKLCIGHFYLDLVFHENRLSPKALCEFYEKGQEVIKSLQSEGLGIEQINYPASYEPYVLEYVLPVIKRIQSFSKAKEGAL